MPVLCGRDIRKTFHRDTGEVVAALDGVSLEAHHGTLTALVGPDGAGKTTLMRLAAGLMMADAGVLQVLGVDVATDPQQVQARIGYMPQKFGLYEDLSVQENLNLYADLHGVSGAERQERYPRLLEMTALAQLSVVQGTSQVHKTIDVTIEYLRPGRAVTTYARADLRKVGRRIANIHVEAWQEARSKPIAALQGHFLLGSEG